MYISVHPVSFFRLVFAVNDSVSSFLLLDNIPFIYSTFSWWTFRVFPLLHWCDCAVCNRRNSVKQHWNFHSSTVSSGSCTILMIHLSLLPPGRLSLPIQPKADTGWCDENLIFLESCELKNDPNLMQASGTSELLGNFTFIKWCLKKWSFLLGLVRWITIASLSLPKDDANSATESLSLEACSTSALPVMWENKCLCIVFLIETESQIGHFANYATGVVLHKMAKIPMVRRAF